MHIAAASRAAQPIPVRVPTTLKIWQHLEVLEVATKEVITAIESLSPINKRLGQER
ncbi:MAG: DUF4058 family protein [Leptolyngbya sp. SIO1D8]|nr:DUF4058 family protein [Leptolyngbya sp. SIO1D8]